MSKILLIDTNNLATRVFHQAMASFGGASRQSNESANEVLYGCINVLGSIAKRQGFDHIVSIHDGERNWRHDIDPQYKGGYRPHSTTSRLGAQLQRLPAQLATLGITTVSVPYLEADDTLALTAEALATDHNVFAFTQDKDALALVSDKLTLITADKKVLTPANISSEATKILKSKHPLQASDIPLFRAFVGDDSDQLTGVPGIKAGYASMIIKALTDAHLPPQGHANLTADQIAAIRSNPQLAPLLPDTSIDILHHNLLMSNNLSQPARQHYANHITHSPLILQPLATDTVILEQLGKWNFKQFATYMANGAAKKDAWGFNRPNSISR